uniref:7TM_GPCR_Srx domain-containing protein n=1 Tax=Caenorhabditis tropicalis TaxID=1561998 RepID=A0A1I7TQ55_9PELO
MSATNSTSPTIPENSESDVLEEIGREDVLSAAAVIFFVAFFGLIFNFLGITVVMKNPILKNSFGTLCLSHSIANYDQCYITYDPITWTWNFAPTKCGFVISTYTDYYTSVAIFCAMSSVDFTTLILLVTHRKHSHFTSNEESVKRRKVEIRFFMQSCLQGILFFYEIFNFYYVSTLNPNQWYVFFTATFAWEICHCLDGFVVVLFHFRRRIFLADVTPLCFFGLLLNALAVLIVLRSPHFVKSYGTLLCSHLFLNILSLLVWFLWVTPLTYT